MAKFIVRKGYAYHVPKSVTKISAGDVVELDNIEVGDQKWKLEPAVELKKETPKVDTSKEKKETKKERKAREKAEAEAEAIANASEGE